MKHLSYFLAFIALLLAATACSDNEPQAPATDEPTKHYATMTLDGGIVDYNASRAITTEWHDGDSLFIKFYEGTKEIKAIASYRHESNIWLIECYDFPTEGYAGKCDIVYIAKSVSHGENSVTLDNNSMPYSATNASYSYVGGTYSVEAMLKHDLGRIRFKGEAGTKVKVAGFRYYNQFSINDHTYSDVEFNDTITIGSDGYSPYCYGFYPTDIEKQIWIYSMNGSKFWRKLLSGAMQPGTSGFLNIPTPDNHTGWECTLTTGTHEGRQWADLGLPSGNLWATENVGYENNYQYRWGATTPGDDGKSLNNDINISGTEYDVAHTDWGGDWVMPDHMDINELYYNCEFYYEESYAIAKGPNGNTIRLPYNGLIWSAKCYSGTYAYVFDCSKFETSIDYPVIGTLGYVRAIIQGPNKKTE